MNYFSEHDIAHNVYITRGSPFNDYNDFINYSAIKIFIWARQSVIGHKQPKDFCVAVCELSGQMLIYTKEAFENMTEDIIIKAHQNTCEEMFNFVKPNVIKLCQ